MAYPYYNSIQPSYQQMTYPQYQQPMSQLSQPNTFQNGTSSQLQAPIPAGFVRVQSEDEARRYPVAPGSSVTFIDDNSPHCYVKSASLSQLDPPVFKRFRLVEENEPIQSAKNDNMSNETGTEIDLSPYAKIADVDALKNKISDISAAVERLRFDVEAFQDKSTRKMVQKARKDADEE